MIKQLVNHGSYPLVVKDNEDSLITEFIWERSWLAYDKYLKESLSEKI